MPPTAMPSTARPINRPGNVSANSPDDPASPKVASARISRGLRPNWSIRKPATGENPAMKIADSVRTKRLSSSTFGVSWKLASMLGSDAAIAAPDMIVSELTANMVAFRARCVSRARTGPADGRERKAITPPP